MPPTTLNSEEPLNRRLLAAIQGNPRPPTANTAKLMATALHKTFPSLVMSPLSTLRPKKASIT